MYNGNVKHLYVLNIITCTIEKLMCDTDSNIFEVFFVFSNRTELLEFSKTL